MRRDGGSELLTANSHRASAMPGRLQPVLVGNGSLPPACPDAVPVILVA